MRPSIKYNTALPVVQKKDEIISAIINNQVVIIAGETGSGKTTQLPVICLEAGRGMHGKIGCTQPRRIAAISIANYLAHQSGVEVGNEIGYKIRFNDMDSDRTCIKFMTDGILLAEMRQSPLLQRYDTLIVDEAHERSLNIDFILGYLKKVINHRPDLKIIISSATIDTTLFSTAFGSAPVIEVSGRVFPVEVFYRDFASEEAEMNYVDETVQAVKDVYDLEDSGDILIFMPTERDIREVCNRLHGLRLANTVALPLFSRLSKAEQESIFNTDERRKIVVATNIAETSITVPGIRFVIDSGLARVPEYAPRLRTNRLPIVPVSKASADQRKGRCGRVMDGICIRLYSSEDYLTRAPFTLPEIKRSNLAGVILTMVAYSLGDIETFPFLEPPSRQAITEGFMQLRELGALDATRGLTDLGRKISRLPLDPHVAAMIMAARDENALREVKIIAAALSIVDPRERPYEKRKEADAMHRRFTISGSDPLSLVRLWDAYQDEWKNLRTQNGVRRFCRDHFLSFTRMREWHDVHQLIDDELRKMKGFFENKEPASADAVHRSLLKGLISNCACRNDKGKFRAARGREMVIFPGSALSGLTPEWICCHEIVETSQFFARTVFPIKPEWIEQVAPHLLSRTYGSPWFDRETGFVRATERVSLYGLSVAEHPGVHYGNVDSQKSKEVFIREGLVNEQLVSGAPFYKHNIILRKEIETVEAKLRNRSYFAGEDAIYRFYDDRLGTVTSQKELTDCIRKKNGDTFLFMTSEDITTGKLPGFAADFPDHVQIGKKRLPLQYAFEPGSDRDGVILSCSKDELSLLSKVSVGWILPAIWPIKIEEILRSCPKEIRKKMIPIDQTAQRLASKIQVAPVSFGQALADLVMKEYGITLDPASCSEKCLPDHLSLKIEVFDDHGNIISFGCAEDILENTLESAEKKADDQWCAYTRELELHGISSWECGDIPEHIEIVFSENSIPVYGYPAFYCNKNDTVDLRILKNANNAQQEHLHAVVRLLEIALTSEFAWLERELKMNPQLRLACASTGGAEKIRELLFSMLKRYLLQIDGSPPRKKPEFMSIVESKKGAIKGLGYEALNILEQFLSLYNHNCSILRKSTVALKSELKTELSRYIDELIGGTLSYELFRNYLRYMKAFNLRIQRSVSDPAKYREKNQQVSAYRKRFDLLLAGSGKDSVPELKLPLRMMLEEFAISLFAQQEVKTVVPVSVKRIEKEFDRYTKK
ncbi:MAG: ATP-dependent RNA helicase HrpA [Chitinispirillaceae bacterium]|nr:ATP-dependent RNA helicase HrpA [Chitinispirillaceae bacterium]